MKLRKIAAIAVTGLMVFSMAACGGSSTGSTEAPKTETKAAAEAAAQETWVDPNAQGDVYIVDPPEP